MENNNRYLGQPSNAKLYHVFKKETNESLCGKWCFIGATALDREEIKGNEVYGKGQDCKDCFRKAGLKIV